MQSNKQTQTNRERMRAAMLLVFVAAILYDADANLGMPLTGTTPQVPALGGNHTRVPPARAVPPARGRGNQTGGLKPGKPGKPTAKKPAGKKPSAKKHPARPAKPS